MKTITSIAVALVLAIAAHAGPIGNATTTGVLLGAGAGAVIGNNSHSHSPAKGAVIGAVVGGLAGTIVGQQQIIYGQRCGGPVVVVEPSYPRGYCPPPPPVVVYRSPVAELDMAISRANSEAEYARMQFERARMALEAARQSAERAEIRLNQLRFERERLAGSEFGR